MLELRLQQAQASLLRPAWLLFKRTNRSSSRLAFQKQRPPPPILMLLASSSHNHSSRMVSQWAAKEDTQAQQQELVQEWRA